MAEKEPVHIYGKQTIDHIKCDDILEAFKLSAEDIVPYITKKVHSISRNSNIYMTPMSALHEKVYVVQIVNQKKKWITMSLTQVCIDLYKQALSIIYKLDDELTNQKDKWDDENETVHEKMYTIQDYISNSENFNQAAKDAIIRILIGLRKPI